MKNSLFKRILYAIINFFKILLLYIIKFFLIFFPNNKKQEKQKVEEKITEIKTQKKKKYFKTANTSTPDSMSEKKLEFKINDEIISEEIKYFKQTLSDNQLYLLSILNEEINNYLYKKEDIDIKKVDKELEDTIIELKKLIIPPIIKDIREEKIINSDELQKEIENSILFQKNENNFFNQKINNNEQTNEEGPIINSKRVTSHLESKQESKKIVSQFSQEQNFSPFTNKQENIAENLNNEPNSEPLKKIAEVPKLKLKDEILNVLTISNLVLANVAKELVTTNKQKDTEPVLDNNINQPQILNNESSAHLEKSKDYNQPTSENNKNNENLTQIIQNSPVNETLDSVKENNATQTEPTFLEDSFIKPILETTTLLLNSNNAEFAKEELEDKNYEELEERINKMLDKITKFYIENENSMSEKQKLLLKNEISKLYNLKDNLHNQLENDIKQEEYQLERFIEDTETKGLKDKLKDMNIEHQIDLNNSLLNQVEDLNNMSQKSAAEIEKKLIKLKLRKASKTLEITSILALPFIRNKYFFYFTIGVLVNNHFNFLNNILKRKTIKNTNIEIDKIKRGRDALEKAINLNYDNINYLNQLEQDILLKYPELRFDNEYLSYINQLKNKLAKNYSQLIKKQKAIDKYCYKNLKLKKILKKKNAL